MIARKEEAKDVRIKLSCISSTFPYPFNTYEWPRHNFSLQCQRNIKQVSDENEEIIN